MLILTLGFLLTVSSVGLASPGTGEWRMEAKTGADCSVEASLWIHKDMVMFGKLEIEGEKKPVPLLRSSGDTCESHSYSSVHLEKVVRLGTITYEVTIDHPCMGRLPDVQLSISKSGVRETCKMIVPT